jgi:hypothetical protein
MIVDLKPIAESKVRQLGGDVCGVLVRTEDSEVMAVSEHGRCTRLDAGVMGPVEPAGMSEREPFEQRFPVPAGIYWNEISEQYDALPGTAGFDDVEIYHGQWMGWQAARAQGGQGAEPIGQICDDGEGAYVELYDDYSFLIGQPVYAHPQPAQQGVPESIATDDDVERVAKMAEREEWERLRDDLAELVLSGMEDCGYYPYETDANGIADSILSRYNLEPKP